MRVWVCSVVMDSKMVLSSRVVHIVFIRFNLKDQNKFLYQIIANLNISFLY